MDPQTVVSPPEQPAPVSPEPKHQLPFKALLIMLISIPGIVVGIFGYQWYQEYQQSNQIIYPDVSPNMFLTPSPVVNETVGQETYMNDEFGFEIPSLIKNEINWKPINTDGQILNKLLWHTVGYSQSGEVTLNGAEWSHTITFKSEEERKAFYENEETYFYQKFRVELGKENWIGKIPSFLYENLEFSTADFAGVGCASEGFFKKDSSSVKIIYLYECLDKKYYKESDSQKPFELVYPHIVEYRLFESAITPLEDLMIQIGK